MTDVVDTKTRSRMMSGIKGKNTGPEVLIRSLLHRAGFRFRLHYPSLPGRPDIVLPKYKSLILVNGCFWHGHGCHMFKWPSSNKEFWETKIKANKARDQKNMEMYCAEGWRVMIIWECALKGKSRIPMNQLLCLIQDWLYGGCDCIEISGFSEVSGS